MSRGLLVLGISANRVFPSANPRNPKLKDIVNLEESGFPCGSCAPHAVRRRKIIRCTPQVRPGGGIPLTQAMPTASYIGSASDLSLMPVLQQSAICQITMSDI